MIKLRENTRHPLWRQPRHHMDCGESHDHVHWIELFYDLIHVVAVFVLGNFVSHHFGVGGFLLFVAIFAVIWMAWADISWFNSLYVSTDMYHRLYMTALIITVMLATASIETLEHHTSWMVFALAYAVNRFIIARLYWRACRIGDSTQQLPTEMARNYTIMGVVYAVSAFLPQPFGYYVFGAMFVFNMIWFALPKISPLRLTRNRPRLGHMAERFALLVLIVSGEGFFKLVVTLSEKGIHHVSVDVLINNVFGALSLFAVCWVYYDFAGNAKPKDDRQSTLFTWLVAHLFLMLGAVMMGVAMVGEVKAKMLAPFPTEYAFMGCFGLILFLLMLTVLRRVNEPRTAYRFGTDNLRWFGIIVAICCYFIVPYVPSIVGNALFGIALFSQILVTMWRATRTLAKEGDL